MPTNKKSKGGKKLRKQQARKEATAAASSAPPVDDGAAALAAARSPPGAPGPVWPEHSPSLTGKLEVAQVPPVRKDGDGDPDGQAVHDWGEFGRYLDELASQQQRRAGQRGANITYWFSKYRQAFVPLDLAGPPAMAAGYQDALERLASEPGIKLVAATAGSFERQRSDAWRNWTAGSDVTIVCLLPGHPLHRSELGRNSPHGDQLIVFPDGGGKSSNPEDCPLVRQVCLLYSGPLVRTVRRYEPRAVLDRYVREMIAVPRKMQAFFKETSPRRDGGLTAQAMEEFMSSLTETSECGVCQEERSASRRQLVSCMYCSYEVCPACLSRMESCPQCRFRYRFKAPEAREGRGAGGLERTDAAVDGEGFGQAFDSFMSEALARMSEKATSSSDETKNVNDPKYLDALFRTARKAFKDFIVHVNGDPKSQMLLKKEGCWSDLMTLNAKWRTEAADAHSAPYSPAGLDFFHGLKEQHSPINGVAYEHPEAVMTGLWQAYTRAAQQYRLVRQARAAMPQTRDRMLLFQGSAAG